MGAWVLEDNLLADLRDVIANRAGAGRGESRGAPAPARGLTWVKVTGAPDAQGWHPGLVSLDRDGAFADLADAVQVAAADGSELESGKRYPCTRTGQAADGKARFRTLPVMNFGQRTVSVFGELTADDTWTDAATGTFTFPGAGWYWVSYRVTGHARVSAMAAGAVGVVKTRLIYRLGGSDFEAAPAPATHRVIVSAQEVGKTAYGNATVAALVQVTDASAAYMLQGLRVGGPTWSSAWLTENPLSADLVQVWYLKLTGPPMPVDGGFTGTVP